MKNKTQIKQKEANTNLGITVENAINELRRILVSYSDFDDDSVKNYCLYEINSNSINPISINFFVFRDCLNSEIMFKFISKLKEIGGYFFEIDKFVSTDKMFIEKSKDYYFFTNDAKKAEENKKNLDALSLFLISINFFENK